MRKQVVIVLSMTLPATGKTTTINSFKQHTNKFCIEVVSSDDIRSQKMM